MRSWLLSVLLALATACDASQPPVRVVTLGAARDTLTLARAEVTDVAWLGGDRWATLAAAENAVDLVDFGAHSARPLRQGSRGELANPFAIFAAGDTLFVADWGKRRLSLWSAAGRLLDAVPALDAARGALPAARDARGRFYVELHPPAGPDGGGNRDSATVLRTEPGSTHLDTVARLSPLDLAEVESNAGRRFERRVFSGSDQWGLLDDGHLWVARVYRNRVELVSADGSRTRGEPLPDRLLEVTEYDRELFRRRFPKELRANASRLPYAALKPAFEHGFSDGAHIWLERSRAPADSARGYLVVDGSGRLVREIRLPGQGRILGVRDGMALVATPAAGGTRLARYSIPAP